jgi:hypothetical protein
MSQPKQISIQTAAEIVLYILSNVTVTRSLIYIQKVKKKKASWQ